MLVDIAYTIFNVKHSPNCKLERYVAKASSHLLAIATISMLGSYQLRWVAITHRTKTLSGDISLRYAARVDPNRGKRVVTHGM